MAVFSIPEPRQRARPIFGVQQLVDLQTAFQGQYRADLGPDRLPGRLCDGDSPGVNTQYGATLLGGTGTEFDIGGITPGNSNNNYGQLNTSPTRKT